MRGKFFARKMRLGRVSDTFHQMLQITRVEEMRANSKRTMGKATEMKTRKNMIMTAIRKSNVEENWSCSHMDR